MTGQLSIDWAPLLPGPVLLALALASLLVVGLALATRAPGTWWRSLAAVVLLLALANPSVVQEERDPLNDIALVLLDQSASQDIEPRPAQSEAALSHLMTELGRMPGLDVQVVRAGGGAARLDKGGTRLFGGALDALAKVPRGRVAGLIVVSDGQIHDVPKSLATLGIDAPVHLLRTGRDDERDRRITVTQAPSFGIVGRELGLSFRVDQLPDDGPQQTVQVTLRQDGGAAQPLMVPTGVEQSFAFEVDHRGPSVLEIEVETQPEELTLVNNRAAIVVHGVRDRLRVLLVSGEPHAGERAWRNILKSDPSVDLVHFTILRPPEKQDGTPIRELSLIAFPTRELFEVKLHEFDLIIFDRYRRRGVLPSIYLDNIARYVERGGALLEAVGPTFATPLSLFRTPLGRVLPGEPTGQVLEAGFRPAVTALGDRHPVTADLRGNPAADGTAGAGEERSDRSSDRPWGRWFRQIEADPTRGSVVMEGIEGHPLLILDRVGEGRVAQFLSDHMWLWSRGFEGGGPQAELLRRVAHWLMREPDLEEEDLRAEIDAGRLVVRRRSLDPASPEIQVTLPSGATRSLTLAETGAGRSQGSIPVSESGLYRASDGTRVALAAAGPLNPLEYRDVRSTAEALAPLVEESGGGMINLATEALPALRRVKPGRDRHGRDWLGLVSTESYLVTGISQAPVLPALLILLLAGAGAVMAWYREGR